MLGNAIRVDILRVLGDADGQLAFSALFDRADVDDSGQFNYHLDTLVGHFVRKSDVGYRLTRPGRRVVEAVFAGTVTGEARLRRTPVDGACEYCGAALTVEWRAGSVELYCTGCAGRYAETHGGKPRGHDADRGYLGRLLLPPAGLVDRDTDAVLDAAWTWTMSEVSTLAGGICPRCAAAVDRTVLVCRDHQTDGQCSNCASNHAVGVRFDCSNCILRTGGSAMLALATQTELLAFPTDHGLNPLAPDAIGRLNETSRATRRTFSRSTRSTPVSRSPPRETASRFASMKTSPSSRRPAARSTGPGGVAGGTAAVRTERASTLLTPVCRGTRTGPDTGAARADRPQPDGRRRSRGERVTPARRSEPTPGARGRPRGGAVRPRRPAPERRRRAPPPSHRPRDRASGVRTAGRGGPPNQSARRRRAGRAPPRLRAFAHVGDRPRGATRAANT